MKRCVGCISADWLKTATGKLHPSGNGYCVKKIIIPPLPASMYWLSSPQPFGGLINRRRELNEHCPYFARKEK